MLIIPVICVATASLSAAEPAPNTLSAVERAAGWELAFDGESLDGWRGYRQDGPPERGWVVEGGTLRVVAGGGGGDLITEATYGDFEFAFAFRVAPKANSGVIYRVTEDHDATWQTGPEFQVLDDAGYGAEADSPQATGALYALYAAPADKPSKPSGEWNRGRIRVCDGYVQHFLNGRLVVEADMTSDDWTARIAASKFDAYEGFGVQPEGHIALQDHGNDVWYRDLKIRRLDRAPIGATDMIRNDVPTRTVFKADPADADTFSVEGDLLRVSGTPTGYARTEAGYADYVLSLRWRFPAEAGNSGVLLNIRGEDTVWPDCIEPQLMSGNAGDIINIGRQAMEPTDRTRGIVTPRQIDAERPLGRWNMYEIINSGGTLTLHINGQLVNEVRGVPTEAGAIGLQSEGVPIEFRDIHLSPIGG